MDKKIIDEDISVSGQIRPDDILGLKTAGVKSIICNRPDNEDPGQINYQLIEQAALDEGLEFRFLPVVSGQVSLKDAIAFDELTDGLPKPIHAYCRSGTRSTTLWALAALKKGMDKNQILQKASQAGYDLSQSI